MKKTFKKLITSLMFLVLVFFFTGCGGGGGGGGGGGSAPAPTPTPTSTSNLVCTLTSDGAITRYAVMVGVIDYSDTGSDLDYCVKDVNDLHDSLNGSNNWSITTLDTNTTESNIISYFEDAVSQLSNTGTFLFFFSGHGSHSGSTGYIVTSNGITNEYISEDDLEGWLAAFPSTVEKIVILDSCYSGAFIGKNMPPNTKIKFLPMPGSEIPYKANFLKDITTVDNLFTMTACTGDEESAESGALENGVFAHYLVEGLGVGAAIGPADTDLSGIITCLKAFVYADPKATAFNADQHAQDYNGGNWTIKQ